MSRSYPLRSDVCKMRWRSTHALVFLFLVFIAMPLTTCPVPDTRGVVAEDEARTLVGGLVLQSRLCVLWQRHTQWRGCVWRLTLIQSLIIGD